ncbi:MAG: GIN domain-containing protein, partial [Muribaculaceae bacterium]
LRGSGDIDITSLHSEGETSLTLSGSGDINVGNIVAGEVSAHLKGSGDLIIKSIDAANKSTIALSGSGDLDVSSVRAPIISSSLTGSGDLKVNTAIGNEVEMALRGSGDANAKTIEAYKCSVTLEGTGDASVNSVKADVITATSSGSCTLSLKGSVRKATYKASGSAELKASHLLAREVTASCNKKSEIQLNASESLKCTIGDKATLKYSGSPRISCSGKQPIEL